MKNIINYHKFIMENISQFLKNQHKGYRFYVGDVELPFAPSELTMSINGNNKTAQLIDGSEINILKNPKLTDISFDIDLPRGRQYPFAKKLVEPEIFTDYFEKIMVNKTPVVLLIQRPNPSVNLSYSSTSVENDFYTTKMTVTLESYDLKESAENAFDVRVSLKFKQYKEYGTVRKKIVENNEPKVTVEEVTKSPAETENLGTYEVKSGDNLWNIAKAKYGSGSKNIDIYNANKDVIENTAKKYGKKSSYKGSTPGWWIYPGTELVLPKLD